MKRIWEDGCILLIRIDLCGFYLEYEKIRGLYQNAFLSYSLPPSGYSP